VHLETVVPTTAMHALQATALQISNPIRLPPAGQSYRGRQVTSQRDLDRRSARAVCTERQYGRVDLAGSLNPSILIPPTSRDALLAVMENISLTLRRSQPLDPARRNRAVK